LVGFPRRITSNCAISKALEAPYLWQASLCVFSFLLLQSAQWKPLLISVVVAVFYVWRLTHALLRVVGITFVWGFQWVGVGGELAASVRRPLHAQAAPLLLSRQGGAKAS
jgi:hypothetical protein